MKSTAENVCGTNATDETTAMMFIASLDRPQLFLGKKKLKKQAGLVVCEIQDAIQYVTCVSQWLRAFI